MGRYQIAAAGSSLYLADTENGNVYVPVEGKDAMVWKLHVKGDVQRKDRVTRPLRTLPLDETP